MTEKTIQDAAADCPECADTIDLEDRILHELVECPTCTSPLEVTSLDPPSLDLAPLEEEDWGE